MHLTAEYTDRIVSVEIKRSGTQIGVPTATPQFSRPRSRQRRYCTSGIPCASYINKEAST